MFIVINSIIVLRRQNCLISPCGLYWATVVGVLERIPRVQMFLPKNATLSFFVPMIYNKMFLATKKSGKVLRIYFVRRAILIIFLDYIICSIENSGTFIIVAAVTVNCMHFKT